LPATYPLSDAVANIQSAALLGLAFAQGRADLLSMAMRDRIHQPYRAPICPLLPILLPLVGTSGIAGVALSGAGPAVLVIVDGKENLDAASWAIEKAAQSEQQVELVSCRFVASGSAGKVKPSQELIFRGGK